MFSAESCDENAPPTLSPKKPRPLGFYAKTVLSSSNSDLKAMISSPYGLSMGRVGLGLAEGMKAVPLSNLNLLQASSVAEPNTLSTIVLRQPVERSARRHSVLVKRPAKVRSVTPSRLPMKQKVTPKVAVRRTRSSQESRFSQAACKRTPKHASVKGLPIADISGSNDRTTPFFATPTTKGKRMFLNSLGSRTSFPQPPVPSLPTTLLIRSSADKYESLLNSIPSLEALIQSGQSCIAKSSSYGSIKQTSSDVERKFSSDLQIKALSRVVSSDVNDQNRNAIPCSERNSCLNPASRVPCGQVSEQHLGLTSTTMLDTLDARTMGSSLLHSSRSLQDLEHNSHAAISTDSRRRNTSSARSIQFESFKDIPFGSVKPRLDFRSSIATSSILPLVSPETITCNGTRDSPKLSCDSSLLMDETPSFAALNNSVDVSFTESLSHEDHVRNKHERLLAAILDILPLNSVAMEKPLPRIVMSDSEGWKHTTPLLNRSIRTSSSSYSIDEGVPAIVVTDAGEGDPSMISSSSTFSIIDFYAGQPEMPCLGPQSRARSRTIERSSVTLLSISKVNVLRNSVSFSEAPNNERLSAVTRNAPRTDKRRSSFLSPGLPSSFLSMSAINEDAERGGRLRRSFYASGASGLKGLFRSSSKISLARNDGRTTSTASALLRREDNNRRISSWGIFKWMKG